MKPLEFITDCGDGYNDPVGAVMEALRKPLKILSSQSQEWEVLSYYFDEKNGQMVLDIQEKKKKKKK